MWLLLLVTMGNLSDYPTRTEIARAQMVKIFESQEECVRVLRKREPPEPLTMMGITARRMEMCAPAWMWLG